MSTFISIHGAKMLEASTVQGGEEPNRCSPHFTINFEGENFENRGAITIYVDDEILSERLIAAFNRTIAERKAEISAAEPQEEAA